MKIIPKIDGASITESTTAIIDKWRFRKYADPKHISVVWVNEANTIIKLLDGKIDGMNLKIPAINSVKLLNKTYISLSGKKNIIKVCIVKEDINSTLDILVTDITKVNSELLKTFVNLKLLQDLQGFNLGQVVLGVSIGFLIGFGACIVTLAIM